MSRNEALAHAARKIRALADRLPEEHRPDLAAEWGELTDQLEDVPDYRALPLIRAWEQEMVERLAPADAPPEVAT